MTVVRSGPHAELDGEAVSVRSVRKGVWQQWEPVGHSVRLVGPELDREGPTRIVHITTHGTLGGHRFRLTSGPDDLVTIHDPTATEDVVRRFGLTGNPYDGWSAQVRLADVDGVVETVAVLHEGSRP